MPVSLEGTWRWVEWKSDAAQRTPASTQYDRFLILREGDSHEYWGKDSTGTYTITSGLARVRDAAEIPLERPPGGAFLLELENWNLQVASLSGRDTLVLTPATPSDMAPQPTRRFVRLGPGAFEAPRKHAARFKHLRLPAEISYQEVEAAHDAVRRSTFTPAVANGGPVAAWTSMAYSFQAW